MVVNVGGDPTTVRARWVTSNGQLTLTDEQPRVYGKRVKALFLTSGTTESERIVGHREESLVRCADEMAQVLELDTTSRVALTLELSFHYGFSVMTSTFSANATLLLPVYFPVTEDLSLISINGCRRFNQLYWQVFRKGGVYFLKCLVKLFGVG